MIEFFYSRYLVSHQDSLFAYFHLFEGYFCEQNGLSTVSESLANKFFSVFSSHMFSLLHVFPWNYFLLQSEDLNVEYHCMLNVIKKKRR